MIYILKTPLRWNNYHLEDISTTHLICAFLAALKRLLFILVSTFMRGNTYQTGEQA